MKTLRNIIQKLAFCSISIVFLLANNATAQQHKNTDVIQALCNTKLRGASVGISMMALQSQTDVFGLNENLLLRPASIQKLFTTGVALTKMGADYQYRTVISYSGTIENGVLNGALIFTNNGDPTLGSRFYDETKPSVLFENILSTLQALKITSITDGVIIESNRFTSYPVPDTWLWQDIGNYYGAPASGFTFMDNTYYIVTDPIKNIGDTVTIKETYPKIPGLDIDNYVTGANIKGDQSYIYGGGFHTKREFRGSLPINKPMMIKGAMPSPDKIFIQELSQYLKQHGISISDSTSQLSPVRPRKEIGTIFSPKLKNIAKITNKKSHNLFAEHLLLTSTKDEKSYQEHLDKFKEILVSEVESINNYQFYDACGLSPFNIGSAKMFTEYLVKMQSAPCYADYQSSLAVAGYDGTLKYWFRSNGLSGKVFAKTGSMTGVRSLAGYVLASDNQLYAFCIIVNNYTNKSREVKTNIEEILKLLVDGL